MYLSRGDGSGWHASTSPSRGLVNGSNRQMRGSATAVTSSSSAPNAGIRTTGSPSATKTVGNGVPQQPVNTLGLFELAESPPINSSSRLSGCSRLGAVGTAEPPSRMGRESSPLHGPSSLSCCSWTGSGGTADPPPRIVREQSTGVRRIPNFAIPHRGEQQRKGQPGGPESADAKAGASTLPAFLVSPPCDPPGRRPDASIRSNSSSRRAHRNGEAASSFDC